MENNNIWIKEETNPEVLGLLGQIREAEDNQLWWCGSNRYYQPNLSELYIGYECEINPQIATNPNLWQPAVLQSTEQLKRVVERFESIRTKYLDSDDIISLGFKTTDNLNFVLVEDYYDKEDDECTGYEYHLNRGTATSHISIDRYEIRFGKSQPSCYEGRCDRIFSGKCKSKNELKTILSYIK